MEFKESKTYQNLQKAFEGEMKASTKYRLYGAKAEEDGYIQISGIFDSTAHNEQEHAEIWLRLLHGGKVPSTLQNLKDASAGESYEWNTMYPEFAKTARDEGFEQIARLFDGVGAIEYSHDRRFQDLAANIENGRVFCRSDQKIWVCINCGTLYRGICAPEKCPVCGYPQGYFELACNNY